MCIPMVHAQRAMRLISYLLFHRVDLLEGIRDHGEGVALLVIEYGRKTTFSHEFWVATLETEVFFQEFLRRKCDVVLIIRFGDETMYIIRPFELVGMQLTNDFAGHAETACAFAVQEFSLCLRDYPGAEEAVEGFRFSS